MQQGRAQGGCGHAELGQDGCHGQWVGDIGFAALPGLAAMIMLGGMICPFQLIKIGLGMVGTDHGEQGVQHGRLRGAVAGTETGQTLPHAQPGLFRTAGDPIQGRGVRSTRPASTCPIRTVYGVFARQSCAPSPLACVHNRLDNLGRHHPVWLVCRRDWPTTPGPIKQSLVAQFITTGGAAKPISSPAAGRADRSFRLRSAYDGRPVRSVL